MVVVKSYPEESDQYDTIYWKEGDLFELLAKQSDKEVMLQGSDVVEKIFNRPLSEVIGCRIRVRNYLFTANYRYSEQKAFAGRDKAFWYIAGHRIALFKMEEPKELTSSSDLAEIVAFDCETGGKTGVRCISFYDGDSWYVDCRDLKSNPKKKQMLIDIFTSKRFWIAHNFAHDCEQVMKLLKIPFFPCHVDTITEQEGFEFRSLQYLSGVVLGVAPYKHELEIANNTKDFDKLVRYCCNDSKYTYYLMRVLNRFPPKSFVNQFIHTMLFPPQLAPRETIFDYYPKLIGLNKKELKANLNTVETKHVKLLLKAINPPKPTITLHSIDGFKVLVPEDLTYKGELFMKSSTGCTDVMDIMAHSLHFSGPEIDVYRYKHNIEPKLYEPVYDIDPEEVFLVNDVVCLTTKPKEGFIPCEFDQVRMLFYGQ